MNYEFIEIKKKKLYFFVPYINAAVINCGNKSINNIIFIPRSHIIKSKFGFQ